MVIGKLHVVVLLALSVALHVTMIVPSGSENEELTLHIVAALRPELSLATGAVNDTLAVADTPLVDVTDTDTGHASAGGSASTMVNGKLQLLGLLALSVAMHVTIVVESTGNRLTDESTQVIPCIPDPSVALMTD